MKKNLWDEAFEGKVIITFDSSVWPEIQKMIGLTGKLNCCYCGRKITKKNVGGITTGKKVMCRNTFCLLEDINMRKGV